MTQPEKPTIEKRLRLLRHSEAFFLKEWWELRERHRHEPWKRKDLRKRRDIHATAIRAIRLQLKDLLTPPIEDLLTWDGQSWVAKKQFSQCSQCGDVITPGTLNANRCELTKEGWFCGLCSGLRAKRQRSLKFSFG